MSLKPWPRDVVVVVCENPAWADRKRMDWPLRMECRDCCRNVLIWRRTLFRAWSHPQRFGRPVALLCTACIVGYDHQEIQVEDRPA